MGHGVDVWILVGLGLVVVVFAALALFTALIMGLVEAAIPPVGQTAAIEGSTIRYLDVGSGSPIVLIHGLAGNLRHFTYALVDRLKDDHRLIVIERPGCGYSLKAPGAAANLAVQARVVVGLLDKLGVDRPLLVGHSLGGALALAMALDHPDAIGGLALVAPASHPAPDAPSAFRLMATASPLQRWLRAWFVATPASILFGSAVLKQIFGPDAVPTDFGKRGGGLLGLRPSSFIASSAELETLLTDLPMMAARYSTIRCPVGILFGDRDMILDAAVHGAPLVAKIEGATIDYVEGGGHMTPLVAPDQTARFVRAVAARIAQSARETRTA
jgi:pimeloyl-ACP methyl ester carboxylesterase